MLKIRRGLICLMALSGAAAEAQTINFTAVQTGPNSSGGFDSIGVDQSTGQIYERYGYDGEPVVNEYANVAALAAGTPSATVTLQGGYYGTYIAISNGQLFGRSDNTTSATASWSLSTGVQSATLSGYSGMGGQNGSDTFDWGGYSGVNFMQDSTGTYVLGHTAGTGNWQIETLGSGLNPTSSTSFSPIGGSTLGYGFVLNGVLFTGSTFDSNIVNESVNVSTGQTAAENITLAGLPSTSGYPYYLSDFAYDSRDDILFAFNTDNDTLYEAQNASVQFGVASAPEIDVTSAASALTLLFGGLAVLRGRVSGSRWKDQSQERGAMMRWRIFAG